MCEANFSIQIGRCRHPRSYKYSTIVNQDLLNERRIKEGKGLCPNLSNLLQALSRNAAPHTHYKVAPEAIPEVA